MSRERLAGTACIVLGLETQIGLGAVRELGRAGVHIIGITDDPHAIGAVSRFVSELHVVGEQRGPDTLALIRRLGMKWNELSLLTVSETNIAWLQRHRHELGRAAPAIPPDEAFAIALDKRRTLHAAEQVGVDTPVTKEPMSWEDVEAIGKSFPFPAVLKWRDPHEVSAALSASGIPLLKSEYVYTQAEYLSVCQRYRAVGKWPLIQQYCNGQGLGQFFFMHDGEALRRFQHLRVAEWPPEGGFSSVCDSVPLDQFQALQERSIALLRMMGWEGLAMVEYRVDMATSRALLMEVNGRLWGSFPLAVHCGAQFALAAHLAGIDRLELLPPATPPRSRRCRMVVTECKRLVRIVLQPGRIADRQFKIRPVRELARFLFDFARPRVRYYVWSLDDPMPFLRDVVNACRKASTILPRLQRRKA